MFEYEYISAVTKNLGFVCSSLSCFAGYFFITNSSFMIARVNFDMSPLLQVTKF